MVSLGTLARGETANAVVGWMLVCVIALAGVWSALTDSLLWSGFAALVLAVAVAPAAVTRRRTAMVPWPLLFVVAATAVAGAAWPYSETAGYVAVGTFALVAVVELDAFTPVDMSRRFAVGFAALTTLAFQAVWTVAQFYSDRLLGTEFLRSQTELQWDIVAVTVVGLVLGGVFVWYFERFGHAGSHNQPVADLEP